MSFLGWNSVGSSDGLGWSQEAFVGAWGFVFGGAAGGWALQWSPTSFVTLFMIVGSASAMITVVLANSSGAMQKDLLVNLAYMAQDLPMFLGVSLLMSIISVIVLIIGFMALEETLDPFLEPIFFFIPEFNQNALVASIIGRLSVAVFFSTMVANLFMSTLYAYPIAVLLYLAGFSGGKPPARPNGDSDYSWANLPKDLATLVFAAFIAFYTSVIQGITQGHPEWILGYFPEVLDNIGTGFGATLLDITGGSHSSIGQITGSATTTGGHTTIGDAIDGARHGLDALKDFFTGHEGGAVSNTASAYKHGWDGFINIFKSAFH